jgi:beta-phosphoglucomutase
LIKAVIFDLDGVLVSTDFLHYSAWKRLADEEGIMGFNETDALRQRGVSRMASLEILLEKSEKVYTETEKTELADRKNGYYVDSLSKVNETSILKGVTEFIEALKEKGMLLGVGSASKNAPLILQKTDLLKYMDAVVCGLEVTRSKPDPQVFLMAAEKLGVKPENCLVIEDADAGVAAAKSGGMYALAVGAAKENPDADYSAESLEDFKSVLDMIF